MGARINTFGRWSQSLRVAVAAALLAVPIAVALLGSQAVSASEPPPLQVTDGRIVPGVRVGSVDLSNLDQASARLVLNQTYSGFGQGEIQVATGPTSESISYATISRRLDVDRLLDEAYAIGRTGTIPQRLAQLLQSAIVGVSIAPAVTFDQGALASRLNQVAAAARIPPVDAKLQATKKGFSPVPAQPGMEFDPSPAMTTLPAQLSDVAAPETLTVSLPATPIAPVITDDAAQASQAAAAAMVQPVVLANSGDKWTIPASVVQSWISFAPANGTLQPTVNRSAVVNSVAPLAARINRPPVEATWSFTPDGVKVVPSRNGRRLYAGGTADKIIALLLARAQGTVPPTKITGIALTSTPPKLSTEQAQAAASKFTLLSTWTTHFQPAAHNGFGANIWIPAAAIRGTVVQPGQTFNFWNAVGPVTLAKGYRLGGAIINGHTQEGVALGGGICSTSTTLFNAALRAGFQMGERSNHFYYISRYPVGLDATVSIQGNAVQNMTWVNDSPYPVLIQSFNGPASVTFSLYGVPTGRTISLSKPIISNYTIATTKVVQTSALPDGARRQVEYADNGFNSSVTRTVRDAAGKIIHQETYFSHYATITGLILVGDSTAPNIPIPANAP